MTLFQAIILGLIQGLGEFLPISSSGHLVLTPWLLGFPDPGLALDVALHLGTLIALVLYFWKDFLQIVCLAFSSFSFGKAKNNNPQIPSSPREKVVRRNIGPDEGTAKNYPPNLLWLLILTTIPGAIFGYLGENYAETTFRNPLLVAGTLSIVGLILFLADKYARHTKNINDVGIKDAILIGMSQAIAIIPGISRAGATITTGLFLGLDRTSSARFSFLISAPIIFGATVLKLPDFISFGIGPYEIIAIITAALSGYFAIAFLLKFIERVSYKVFFWYRLLLAVSITFVWLAR